MLSRSDSAASTSLHRSKSNASVQDRRKHPLPSEPFDPEQCRLHALIAAHRAMDRSQSRSSGDLGRADSNASHRTAPVRSRGGHIRFSPATQLRRQRSELQSRTTHLSSTLRAPAQTHIDTHYAEAGPAEFGKMSENYGAEPSSYRKIRRSRSMLTPRRRLFSNPSSPQHSPFSQAPTLRNTASHMALANSGLKLRLKRSLNALRPASRLSVPHRPGSHMDRHDEAVQLAREQYLNDVEENTVRNNATDILSPKVTRQQKAFRKSVRTHQAQSTESPNSEPQASETIRSDGNKRSFSSTLRDRFRRAFGASVSRKASMPPQQLEASSQHFSDEPKEAAAKTSFEDYVVDDEENRRQSFYMPSNADLDAQEEPDRFSPELRGSASRESLHSNARSRVTSWTNSTVTAESFSTRGPALERNRLSIIKEDGGPHEPSSSAGRHIGGIGDSQDPLAIESSDGSQHPAVDSHRIYSALMKRIGDEEIEIERTKAALDDIQKGRRRGFRIPHNTAPPTIRAVSSTTDGALPADERRPHLLRENVSSDEYASGMTPKIHKHNVERRRVQLASQDEQSSFFPFSSEEQSKTPSPFRRLLQERRSEGRSDDIPGHLSMESTTPDENESKSLGVGSLGMSSESIYSRNTDGGLNMNYQRPYASEYRLFPYESPLEGTGMATIIPNECPTTIEVRPELPPSAGSSEKREWSGWMKDQMATLSRTDSRTSKHRRERAQIDPQDVEVGRGATQPLSSRSNTAQDFPFLDLKEVPRNNTPVPRRSSSLTKSQNGLLKRVSFIGLNSALGKHDENRKASIGIRKVSPGNIAKMLRERKSQILAPRTNDKDKENSPTPNGESPPISTPGRLHLQVRSGNGRLRKRASEMAVGRRQATPKGLSTLLPSKSGDDGESPTDRVKQSLTARLSRPFNMDVPVDNRPFDSMYAGRHDTSAPGPRLSVAPRGPKGYGGLGPSPLQADTASPQVPAPSNGSDKMKGLWSSKRMVSDFLKKRRVERTVSDGTDGEDGVETQHKRMTPAFL